MLLNNDHRKKHSDIKKKKNVGYCLAYAVHCMGTLYLSKKVLFVFCKTTELMLVISCMIT